MKNYLDSSFNEDNKGEKKQHVRDMLKKGAAASLAALLIGSLAAGSLVSAEEASKKNDSDRVTLLRTAEEAAEGSAESVVDGSSYEKTVGYLDVSDIVEEAMPSVVSITTTSVEEVMDYFSMFGYGGYAPQEREIEGRGSGVIIGKNDNELMIVTNYHVVEGAKTITVGFVNNTAVEGKVKGYDESKDLAVVSVAKEDLDEDTVSAINIAEVGSSDDIKVGEQVVAIGNAMGYGQSVTTGIVSAKTSFNEQDDYYDTDDGFGNVNLIQTDAAINPGNSGGALLNMDGELIGINSAKLASTEVEGMGYAIAISDVDDEVIEDLMNEEYREKLEDGKHGILGITGATVTSDEVKKYGFPQGVYVSEVTEGGAAEEAGIMEGDFITKFRNKSLSSINQLVDYLDYYEPGEEVDLTIVRDGEEMVITVKLQEQTEEYKKSRGISEDADDQNGRDERDDRRDDGENNDDNNDYDDDRYGWDFDDFWDSWGSGLFGGY